MELLSGPYTRRVSRRVEQGDCSHCTPPEQIGDVEPVKFIVQAAIKLSAGDDARNRVQHSLGLRCNLSITVLAWCTSKNSVAVVNT